MQFNFVQDVHIKIGGVGRTFIDGDVPNLNFPFYYTDQQERVQITYQPGLIGFNGGFYDQPNWETLTNGDMWPATLFIVQKTAAGNNNVVLTINYGFTFINGKVQPIPLTDQ